jgi:glycosyltransferase involved in cell wall biosynthesis
VGGLDVEPGYARRQTEFVCARGWNGRVRFTGYVEPGELAGILKQHDVLAGPSQYEGYGIAYLEALGAGLPVIASTGGAAAEFIRPGENGFLVDPDDRDDLADLLGKLHRDRPLLARLGKQARLSFESHPTWDGSMTMARDFLVGLEKRMGE